eukprot:scaffold155665_cov40-Attheya_sp.AAC.4
MMDAPQYSEPLLPSDCDYDAELTSMMKRPDTSSDDEEYKTGSHQGSFNLHEVISTAVTVEESFNEEVEYAFKKIIQDGTVTSIFYAGVLFSTMTILAGFTGEALFLSSANEIRHYFQTTWVSCLIFSVLWTLPLLIIMNTARVLILHILHASRSAKNEVELKSIDQFLNYGFISGCLTGGSATWVCIDLAMGMYWMALGTIVFPIGILVRNRCINQHIMKGDADDILIQVDDL